MDELLQDLTREGYLKTPAIIEAFRTVRRDDFVTVEELRAAQENRPLPIGYGQTISQPLTVAIMLELLAPKKGDRVLDVGAGSGWTAALLASIVGQKGSVVAIERVPQLARFARANLAKYAFTNVMLHQGDGSLGFAERAPFDCIHVAAAAKEVPAALKEQLKVGGRLVLPVGLDAMQTVYCITRTKKNVYTEVAYPGFTFVPLIEGPSA